MHRDSNQGGGNESQSAQTNFENVFSLMHDMNAAIAIGANGDVMNRTATSIISTKKELMDKLDLVSKTDSKQASVDHDSFREQSPKHDKYKGYL